MTRERDSGANDSLDELDELDELGSEFAAFVHELEQPTEVEPPLRAGTRVASHLEIVRPIGAGSMGIVYLARDLKLHRDVALKFVDGRRSADASARLHREAQAMARLSHPHVVAVYESGTFAADVYIAMEYVDGGTARQWSASAPRSWAEVLDVFVQAGRGLVAAHAAGFVHRDFKPDNVLVGADGRVRVADFGLVSARGLIDAGPRCATPGEPTPSAGLTRTGIAVGTPAYMAPEQFARTEIEPLADQFAFGVALYEALYGERPYGNVTALVAMRLGMRPRAVPSRAPAWLGRIVEQAVQTDPARRFADMAALLDALEHGRSNATRRRRTSWMLGAATIAAAGGLAIGLMVERSQCADIATAADVTWSDARITAIEAALAPSTAALESWRTLRPRVDAWMAEWAAGRRSSCVTSRADGTRSGILLDRSLACFDERLREVDAWLGVLETGGPAATRVLTEVDVLPTLTDCNDTTYLLSRIDRPTDPDDAARADALDASLHGVRVLWKTASGAEAQTLLDELRAPIDALGHAPLQARWHLEAGILASDRGQHDQAMQELQAGHRVARTVGDEASAAIAAYRLAWLEGVERRRTDPAEIWLELLRIDLARGVAPSELAYRAAILEGILAEYDGRNAEAIEHMQSALDIATRQNDREGRLHAQRELAAAFDSAGDHLGAIELFESILPEVEALRGPYAPALETLSTNLGLAYQAVGRDEDAIVMHRRALTISTRRLGTDSPLLWPSLVNLGSQLSFLRRHDESRPLLLDALARVTTFGPQAALDRAVVMMALAADDVLQGRSDEALALYLDVVAIHRSAGQHRHPEFAWALTKLGMLRLDRGEIEEAGRDLADADAIWADPIHEGHANAALTWSALARWARARRDFASARRYAQRVVDRASRGGIHPAIVDACSQLLAEVPAEAR